MKIPESLLAALLSAPLGAALGSAFTAWHFRKRKAYEFTERRLTELYGPLCSRIERLKADGKLKLAISSARGEAWKDKCSRARVPFLDHEEAFAPYGKSIDYENRHFRDAIIPLYDEMLAILDTKRDLAFPSTLTHYDAFYRFVELWHRWLNEAIPGEAIEKIEVREEELQLLYADIETKHAALVRWLSGDRNPGYRRRGRHLPR
jgi:hypothetical protein